jgi:hypothetical protein
MIKIITAIPNMVNIDTIMFLKNVYWCVPIIAIKINANVHIQKKVSKNVIYIDSLFISTFVSSVNSTLEKIKGSVAYDTAVKISFIVPSPLNRTVRHQLAMLHSRKGKTVFAKMTKIFIGVP